MATINYNGVELDQQEFLTNAANEVQRYANNQPWSNKRKQRFLNAYADIMNHGVLGASIGENGIWNIDHNGMIDQTNMSKMDRQMYGEAAYFIQQQMNSLGTKNTKKEEEQKKELPKFDNFGDNFGDYINKKYYGRSGDFLLKDQWNILDERDKGTGLLNTTNRLATLKDYLINYRDSLKDGQYDFTDSPFESLDDLKSRLNNAIEGLNNGDINAINQIGLDPKQWFYNGSSDIVGTDENGNPITYVQQAEAANKIAETKAIEDAQKANAIAQANRGVRNILSGIHGSDARTNPEEYANKLAEKYGTGQEGFNRVNQRIQELFDKAYDTKVLNNTDKKELGNLLFYIRQNNENYKTSNLSDEEWNELNKHQLSDTNRNNYVHLPWKTTRDGRNIFADGQGNVHFVKYSNKANLPNAFKRSQAAIDYRNNFLSNTQKGSNNVRNNYLASKKDGLTSAEWEELASIGFDIASIVDPEMISSAGLALTGSGLRHHAALSQPGGMTTSDKWWQAADYGLSILGSIPVLGDSALAFRAINNLKKAIVPLGVVMAGTNVPQAAKAAYNKVVNGQDLTIQDWRAIGAVLTAAVGVGRGRQMSKRAEALRRTGGNTSKTTKEGVIKTSEGEIKVDEATAKQLETQFKGADGATRTQKLRENAKVKEAARQQGIDLSKAEVQGYGRFRRSPISSTTSTSTTSGNRIATLRAMSEFNKNHGWLARKGLAEQDWVFRHTGGYESAPTSNWFKDTWNNLRKSKWDEFGNKNNPTTNTSSQQQNQGTNTPPGRFDDRSIARGEQFNRAVVNRYKDILSGKFSKNPIKEGKYEFNGIKVEVKKAPTGTYDMFINGKRTDSIKDLTNTELRKQIASLVKEHRASMNRNKPRTEKISHKEMGKILQDLKKKGWLKQGGQINRNVDTIISEFLSKQI